VESDPLLNQNSCKHCHSSTRPRHESIPRYISHIHPDVPHRQLRGTSGCVCVKYNAVASIHTFVPCTYLHTW